MRVDKIILIGPTANLSTGRQGGVTIPFEEFSFWCRERAAKDGIAVKICDLTGSNRLKLFFSYFRAATALISPRRNQYISLHLTWNALIFFSPWIILAKFFPRKIITIRKFAGDFDLRFDSSSWITKKLIASALLSLDIAYFETHYLVKWARRQGYSANWWPNSRAKVTVKREILVQNLQEIKPVRLVYLGRINVEKGIRRLITIANANPFAITIEAFGPVDDPDLLVEISSSGLVNIRYGGLLPHDKVADVISLSDALVLPTGWRAEGYPGVIIEAAMVGVPVLVSAGIRGPTELVGLLGVGWVLDFDDDSAVRAAIQAVRDYQRTTDPLLLSSAALMFESENVFAARYAEIWA